MVSNITFLYYAKTHPYCLKGCIIPSKNSFELVPTWFRSSGLPRRLGNLVSDVFFPCFILWVIAPNIKSNPIWSRSRRFAKPRSGCWCFVTTRSKGSESGWWQSSRRGLWSAASLTRCLSWGGVAESKERMIQIDQEFFHAIDFLAFAFQIPSSVISLVPEVVVGGRTQFAWRWAAGRVRAGNSWETDKCQWQAGSPHFLFALIL